MSRVERFGRKFTALDQVETRNPRIKLDLNLPPDIDQRRLGIRIDILKEMMHYGGIRTLTVVGESSGDSKRTSSSARTEPTYPEQPDYIAGRSTDVNITLHLPKILKRLKHKSDSPKAWAKQIDKAIRREIRIQGREHLTADMSKKDDRQLAIAFAAGIFGSVILGKVLVGWLAWSGLSLYFNYRNYKDYKSRGLDTTEFRFSPFAGPQIDVAMLLSFSSRTSRVVKAHPEAARTVARPERLVTASRG